MERFNAASKAGFKWVEFRFPYEYKANKIKNELIANGLKLISFNLPAGDWDMGDRGIAVDPERSLEFQNSVKEAIIYAKELQIDKLTCLVGKKPHTFTKSEIRHNLIENLIFAADELNKYNIKLLIEPVNSFDVPGFYLNTTKDVIELIKEIDRSNVYLQYDVYHAAREDENLIQVLENYKDQIAHIQISDSPNRFEPGTGEIDYETLFNKLKDINYKGYISMEYNPSFNTIESLAWLNKFNLNL